ncbi:hypothetical protein F5Y18DRAFT_435331 [Xylariaceae sp. FL1019]|nr:hypothetical protein F5Y18DRAFT_435331 [Xylariaceae sp. FL1019]
MSGKNEIELPSISASDSISRIRGLQSDNIKLLPSEKHALRDSERGTRRRGQGQNFEPISTRHILENFELYVTPREPSSRPDKGWEKVRRRSKEESGPRHVPLLPRQAQDIRDIDLAGLDINFLQRQHVQVHVCDFYENKATHEVRPMKDFDTDCREKPAGCLVRWIHVPVGRGVFQSTLEDIFLHSDPPDSDRSTVFNNTAYSNWTFPEINMLTFRNREDYNDVLNLADKLVTARPQLHLYDGLSDRMREDLSWRIKLLGIDRYSDPFWEMVHADFPMSLTDAKYVAREIGPLVSKGPLADIPPQALSTHRQFEEAVMTVAKLRAFNRDDGFLLTFANTTGVDYLNSSFQGLLQQSNTDILEYAEGSVLAHTMNAFKVSGTQNWVHNSVERPEIWLIVYLMTEAVTTPHNIRGGRSAIDIVTAYRQIMLKFAGSRAQPWVLGRSPELVRKYQNYLEELRAVQKVTTTNLEVMENMYKDIKEMEAAGSNTISSRPSQVRQVSTVSLSGRRQESMPERLEWAIDLLKERQKDLSEIENFFQLLLKDLFDLCTVEQNDRAIVTELQNKAVVLITAITVIFLPISAFTGYLGMNLEDIRENPRNSDWFWSSLGVAGVIIAVASIILAFQRTFRGFIAELWRSFISYIRWRRD